MRMRHAPNGSLFSLASHHPLRTRAEIERPRFHSRVHDGFVSQSESLIIRRQPWDERSNAFLSLETAFRSLIVLLQAFLAIAFHNSLHSVGSCREMNGLIKPVIVTG